MLTPGTPPSRPGSQTASRGGASGSCAGLPGTAPSRAGGPQAHPALTPTGFPRHRSASVQKPSLSRAKSAGYCKTDGKTVLASEVPLGKSKEVGL